MQGELRGCRSQRLVNFPRRGIVGFRISKAGASSGRSTSRMRSGRADRTALDSRHHGAAQRSTSPCYGRDAAAGRQSLLPMRCRISPFIAGLPAGQRPAGYQRRRRWLHRYQCAFQRRMSGETRTATLLKISPRSSPSIATENHIAVGDPQDQRIERRHMDIPAARR